VEKRGAIFMVKKDLAIAILATFCLTSTLFMITTSKSQSGITASNEYDPWIDTNDDGIIDIFDLAKLALAFGAEGEPLNKTAMLLELQDRADSVDRRLEQMKTIRFLEPNVTINGEPETFKDGAVFVWTPNNATNNAVLGICCYFEYHGVTPEFRITVNDAKVGGDYMVEPSSDYTSSPVFNHCFFSSAATGPNQGSYTIKFQFGPDTNSVPIYVRNINMLVEVMDGLPAETPN
jgi:hypothetical protein